MFNKVDLNSILAEIKEEQNQNAQHKTKKLTQNEILKLRKEKYKNEKKEINLDK